MSADLLHLLLNLTAQIPFNIVHVVFPQAACIRYKYKQFIHCFSSHSTLFYICTVSYIEFPTVKFLKIPVS